MNQISRETEEVAVLPKFRLQLNLQMFAGEDETPELENSTEFKEDLKEFSAFEQKMEKFTEERKAKETPKEAVKEEKTIEKEPVNESVKAATEEVATPDQKPKQDAETNKAFQEMRQKLEAAEKEKADVSAKAARADALIKAQFGEQGITTVEQYEQWIKNSQESEDNKRYTEAGLKPEEIEKIRKYDELQRETETQKITRMQEENVGRWNALYTAYPDIVESSKAFNEGKDPDWYNDAMKAEISRGASPLAAYRNAHFETILQNTLKNTKDVAKQEALNQLNSKEHIKPNGSMGGDVEHVEIPPEQMKIFRALNKGKSDAEIRKFYKKQTAGG